MQRPRLICSCRSSPKGAVGALCPSPCSPILTAVRLVPHTWPCALEEQASSAARTCPLQVDGAGDSPERDGGGERWELTAEGGWMPQRPDAFVFGSVQCSLVRACSLTLRSRSSPTRLLRQLRTVWRQQGPACTAHLASPCAVDYGEDSPVQPAERSEHEGSRRSKRSEEKKGRSRDKDRWAAGRRQWGRASGSQGSEESVGLGVGCAVLWYRSGGASLLCMQAVSGLGWRTGSAGARSSEMAGPLFGGAGPRRRSAGRGRRRGREQRRRGPAGAAARRPGQHAAAARSGRHGSASQHAAPAGATTGRSGGQQKRSVCGGRSGRGRSVHGPGGQGEQNCVAAAAALPCSTPGQQVHAALRSWVFRQRVAGSARRRQSIEQRSWSAAAAAAAAAAAGPSATRTSAPCGSVPPPLPARPRLGQTGAPSRASRRPLAQETGTAARALAVQSAFGPPWAAARQQQRSPCPHAPSGGVGGSPPTRCRAMHQRQSGGSTSVGGHVAHQPGASAGWSCGMSSRWCGWPGSRGRSGMPGSRRCAARRVSRPCVRPGSCGRRGLPRSRASHLLGRQRQQQQPPRRGSGHAAAAQRRSGRRHLATRRQHGRRQSGGARSGGGRWRSGAGRSRGRRKVLLGRRQRRGRSAAQSVSGRWRGARRLGSGRGRRRGTASGRLAGQQKRRGLSLAPHGDGWVRCCMCACMRLGWHGTWMLAWPAHSYPAQPRLC